MPKLELYSKRDGVVQSQGGLNWGFSDGHVCIDDAYIAITTSFIRDYPDFFPGVGDVINVIWDDGVRMECMVEGTQEIDHITYPKQLSSAWDKSEIGVYLRRRLGVASGVRVTMDDLDRYGRRYVEITRDNRMNVYYMDFSV